MKERLYFEILFLCQYRDIANFMGRLHIFLLKPLESLAQTNGVVCDSSKIRALGCRFTVMIQEGFKRTIDYFTAAECMQA